VSVRFRRYKTDIRLEMGKMTFIFSGRPLAASIIVVDRRHPMTNEIISARTWAVAPFWPPFFYRGSL
jgi:hypothetical protein